jgi:hypothetical protein
MIDGEIFTASAGISLLLDRISVVFSENRESDWINVSIRPFDWT